MAKHALKNYSDAESVQLELIQRNQNNLFWHSTLFNEVYLQSDVPVFHSDVWIDDEVEYEQFLNKFQNFVETLEGENLDSWTERTTINRLIKPLLEMLGYISSSNNRVEPWLEDEAFSVQESDGLKTYKPDFIIVNDHKELKYIQNEKGDKKLSEARASVILPIEAKYWGRIDESRQNLKEDSKRADKKGNADNSRAMDFDEQCLKYMDILNKQYGILTDGRSWRLYSLAFSSPSYRPYFQFNLGHMIKHIQNSDFLSDSSDYEIFKEEIKYFYFIFRKKSLYSENGSELFVDELLNYSKKYVAKVEEDLKNRFVNAMTIACNGFQRATKISKSKSDLDIIRNVSESHIFNVLFLKYCEARNILPIKQDPEGYRLISISNMLDRLEGYDPKKEVDNLNYPLLKRRFKDINYNPEGTQLYDRLIKLTRIVQDGTKNEFKGFSIKGFKESIFSREEWKFVRENKLNNQEMIRILFELGYSESDIQGRKYQQIPYNSFSPRQLGSIYESFLEFKLDKADQDMVFEKHQWKKANLKSAKYIDADIPKVKTGELFFTPDNKDRKASGSFYTPDAVVQIILESTLGPLISKKSTEELLELKVCDPAMGSGHFLAGALNYITRAYLDAQYDEGNDELSVPEVKASILHNCIYGVDLNNRAVKLAKMSLWLETASASLPLEELEDQLKCGDSLEIETNFSYTKAFKSIFNNGGFHATIGNPPWVSYGLRDTGTLTKSKKDSLNKMYPGSAEYKVSLYACFLDKFSDIIREGGRTGIIVPDSFILGMYFSKVRRTLLDRLSLSKLSLVNGDFWGSNVCSGFNVILVGQKESSPAKRLNSKVSVQFSGGLEDLVNGGKQNGVMPQSIYEKQGRNEFRLLFSEDDFEFYTAVSTSSEYKVSDLIKFSSGLISKGKKEEIVSSKQKNKNWHKGISSGGFVHVEKIEYDGEWISFEKPKLKSGFKDARYFEQKLIVRQTSDKIICGLDTKGLLCLNNNHVGNLVEGVDSRVLYLVHLALNSSVMGKYYSLYTLETGRAMAQIDIANLNLMPVPEITEENLKFAEKSFKDLTSKKVSVEKYRLLGDKLYNLPNAKKKVA